MYVCALFFLIAVSAMRGEIEEVLLHVTHPGTAVQLCRMQKVVNFSLLRLGNLDLLNHSHTFYNLPLALCHLSPQDGNV